jgi:hypothetical protein
MKILSVLVVLIALGAQSVVSEPLTSQRTIPLPGVAGKFDHFAIDLAGNRLFAAATGNHSIEVINLASNRVQQSITGLGKPHGLAWVASTGSLYVADGTLAELRVYRGAPLKLAGAIKLSDDADDMVYNEATHLLYVGHGGSDAANPARIAVVDTTHFVLVANLPVATHPEALDIDSEGQRIFANIADAKKVAVIDGSKNRITAEWSLIGCVDNVPLGYDGGHHVLFVACRTPATLFALDALTGKELCHMPTAGGADDLFYDAKLNRVYVIGGAGEVDAYQFDAEQKLHAIGSVPTAAGAKTALFVPSQDVLYVGFPATGGHPAEIHVYSTASIGGGK